MILFLDTEFTNFVRPQLIAIALTSLCGKHEFYAEIKDYNSVGETAFVKNRVLPLLNHEKHGKTAREVSIDLWVWLEELGDGPHEIMADYPTDWELLWDLLGEEIPPNIQSPYTDLHAKLNSDIILKAVSQGRPDFVPFMKTVKDEYFNGFLSHFEGPKSHLQHHALEDTRGIRIAWIKAQEKINEHY